jgi:hypothetical protein
MEGALNQRPLGNDSSKPGQGDALNQRVLAEKGKGLELETGSGTVGGRIVQGENESHLMSPREGGGG